MAHLPSRSAAPVPLSGLTDPMPVSRINTDPGEILPTRDRMPVSAYVAGVLLGVTLSLGMVLVGLAS